MSALIVFCIKSAGFTCMQKEKKDLSLIFHLKIHQALNEPFISAFVEKLNVQVNRTSIAVTV